MNRRAFAVVHLAVVLALTGCTAQTAPAAPTSNPATTRTSAPSPSHTSEAGSLTDEATVAPIPEAGPDGQAAAITAAEKTVTTFAQPTLDASTWINNMYPLLTQRGARAYEGTDPAQIPVRRVTGPGRVVDGSTDVALIVQVPTDAGIYNVSLSRTDASAVWLAEQIRPAQG
ncbi:hypothetical protein [Cryobacterium psychrophilum]|uniref:Uncharacterized protein n=1 Tax=Cryobacterium psychrophilum TaxID=41988 RepID=A0A4Y8KJA0_9MICO|nr:hypothetical protein [Cryobacterium psychrophilum]TDW26993.1 hypothetical protein EDD25_3563 [Cryobacterium psychrophilum]TFD75302.1 hypothetical protein E3T53_15970 [Cryobacterium psychrophilum]